MTRFSVERTLNTLRETRQREQERVVELKQALEYLQTETALRVRSETQLLQARKSESLGLMAAGVAHDFNNNLRAISAVSELIAAKSRDIETQHYAEEICKAVQSLEDLPITTSCNSRAILLIEDDELVYTPVAKMLEFLGWDVTEASSGENAMLALKIHQE